MSLRRLRELGALIGVVDRNVEQGPGFIIYFEFWFQLLLDFTNFLRDFWVSRWLIFDWSGDYGCRLLVPFQTYLRSCIRKIVLAFAFFQNYSASVIHDSPLVDLKVFLARLRIQGIFRRLDGRGIRPGFRRSLEIWAVCVAQADLFSDRAGWTRLLLRCSILLIVLAAAYHGRFWLSRSTRLLRILLEAAGLNAVDDHPVQGLRTTLGADLIRVQGIRRFVLVDVDFELKCRRDYFWRRCWG